MRQRPSSSSSRREPQNRTAGLTSTQNGLSTSGVRYRKQCTGKPPQQQESAMELVKDFLAVFVITMCVGFWVILMWKLFLGMPTARRVVLVTNRALLFQGADILDPAAKLKLPTPIIVVGLPKSGTTSIAGYFRCGRIAASHFSCEVGEPDWDAKSARWRNCRLPKGAGGPMTDTGQFPLCGICVERNIIHGRPPLEGCGPYKVFAELDSAEHPLPSPKSNSTKGRRLRSPESDVLGVIPSLSAIRPLCSYPQINHLDKIHSAYPQATFILNTRPVDRWIQSISKWNGDDRRSEQGYLRQVLTKCNFESLPAGVGESDEEMREFYTGHSERIREFVRKNPSHTLVDINIENENASAVMEAAFGISSICWKQHNPSLQAQKEWDDPASAGPSDGDDDLDRRSGTGKVGEKVAEEEFSSKSKGRASEFMEKLQKEKPNTRLITEYPLCQEIEDIFPPLRLRGSDLDMRWREKERVFR